MAIQVKVRKWGNSIGIVLPSEFSEKQGIKENDKITIEIVKEANIKHLFNSLKTSMSGQKFKSMVKKEWEK